MPYSSEGELGPSESPRALCEDSDNESDLPEVSAYVLSCSFVFYADSGHVYIVYLPVFNVRIEEKERRRPSTSNSAP
jgi:hypothetical protein